MRAVKLGGLAAAGALGLAAFVGTPSAAAKPTPKSTPKSTASPSRSAAKPPPKPTPTIACNPPQAAAALTTEPWAQKRLDFTRVWTLTRGSGVSVAVVDSGVDTTQPQLAGHVTSVDVTHTKIGRAHV